ncbi:MAG: hypothetical protein R2758_07325 [Bacteroidales bacterium]
MKRVIYFTFVLLLLSATPGSVLATDTVKPVKLSSPLLSMASSMRTPE